MDNFALMEYDNILDYFNVEDLQRVINEQINGDIDYSDCSMIIDHYKPVYAKYNEVKVDPEKGITLEDVAHAKNRFDIITLIYMNSICNKFGIDINDFWLENACDNDRFLLTLYLYTFFVVDLKTVLIDIIINYINTNIESLATMFEVDQKNQKGATFNVLKTELSDERYAVICANIFDVILYTLDTIECGDVFDYAPADYVPVSMLKEMFENGDLGGNFNEGLYSVVKANDTLRMALGFEICLYIREHYKA